MEKVAGNIYLVKGECNSYYIDDKTKILIDAGADFDKPVDLLVLTHVHPDHVLFAKKIQTRTGCKILIGENDNILSVLLKFFPEWKGVKIEQFRVDRVLKEGAVLRSGDYAFKILAVPGHTKGSICLFDEEKGILFSGDTLFADGCIGRTDFPHSVPESMETSLKKIEALDYKLLLPGHGRIMNL